MAFDRHLVFDVGVFCPSGIADRLQCRMTPISAICAPVLSRPTTFCHQATTSTHGDEQAVLGMRLSCCEAYALQTTEGHLASLQIPPFAHTVVPAQASFSPHRWQARIIGNADYGACPDPTQPFATICDLYSVCNISLVFSTLPAGVPPGKGDDGAVSVFYRQTRRRTDNLTTQSVAFHRPAERSAQAGAVPGQIEAAADAAGIKHRDALTTKLRLVREGHRQGFSGRHQSGLCLRATAVARCLVEHLFRVASTNPHLPARRAEPNDQAFKTVFEYDVKVAAEFTRRAGTQFGSKSGPGTWCRAETWTATTKLLLGRSGRWSMARRQQDLSVDFWRSPDFHRPRAHARRTSARKRPDLTTGHSCASIGHQRLVRRRLAQCWRKKPATMPAAWLIGSAIMGPECQSQASPAFSTDDPRAAPCLHPQRPVQGLFDPTSRPMSTTHRIPNRPSRIPSHLGVQHLLYGDQGIVRACRQRPFPAGRLRRVRRRHRRGRQ